MAQHKVRVYTETGKLVREWGKPGKGDGEFAWPGGIVLGPGGTVYVADQNNHRVQKFTTEGKFLGKWGEHGAKPGQFGGPEPAGSRFAGPHFLALDSKGRLYTTEGVLGRVQQFSPEGKPLLAWGDKGQQPGGFGALQSGNAKNTFGPIAILGGQARPGVGQQPERPGSAFYDGRQVFAGHRRHGQGTRAIRKAPRNGRG